MATDTIDYIRDNLAHEKSCPFAIFPVITKYKGLHMSIDIPEEGKDCTCPRAEALRWLERLLVCAHCGKPATCLGAYESEENLGLACDDCCGHGNEDGWCVPADEVNATLQRVAQREQRREAFVEAFQAWADESAAGSDGAIEAWDSTVAAFKRMEGE